MSANITVTILRSPSIASDAALSAATMICDLVEETVVEAAAFPVPIAVPHLLQYRAPGLTDTLHVGQINSSLVPHSSQNEASKAGAFVVAAWAAHRASCGPEYYHTPRGRRKEQGAPRAKPRSGGRSTVLGRSSITLRASLAALPGGGLSPSYDRATNSGS